ncbi:MAG: peptidase, partial [Verrucomicrobiae bacterium]|nr:peptidase [Verrucomicrobiae bacterium]
HYLAAAEGDPTRLREFVRVLQGHEIEVELLAEDMEVDGRLYPAKTSIAIPVAQRQSTFLQTLWNTQVEFEENIFYDVSTWTLPYAFNLQHTREPVRRVSSRALPDDFLQPKGPGDLAHSEIGYVIDWRDSASPALLYGLLEEEANVRVAMKPLTVRLVGGEEKAFGYGTLFVAKALNKVIPEKAVTLLKEAAEQGVPVYPVASSFTREGIDLGSREFRVLKKPKVLIATGPGISANDVGEIWHLLDTRIRMPITMVDTDRLASIDYRDYTHVLLTRGLGSLSEGGVKKLKAFVEGGGVLWAQGDGAIKWTVDKELAKVEWRKTEEEKKAEAAKEKKEKKEDEASGTLERRPFADAADEAAFKLVRGAIFATSLDVTHPIGYGYTDEFLPVFRRSNKFFEPSKNAYSTPVQYQDEPLLSGYVNDENLKLIAGCASVVIDQLGGGAVVLALDDPTFRAFWWGTQRLLVNAIFFGDILEEPR